MDIAYVIFVAILTSLGSVTEQVPGTGQNNGSCPPKPIKTQLFMPSGQIREITLGAYDMCKCITPDGKEWKANNGSPCMVFDLGYNDELTRKSGTCLDGKCVVTRINRGCDNKKKTPLGGQTPQVGCAYTCFVDGERQYGYYPAGTNCTVRIRLSEFCFTS